MPSVYQSQTEQTIQPRRKVFTMTTDEVTDAILRDLGASDLGVYVFLARHANREGSLSYSYQRIADACQLSKRQIMRILDDLVNLKVVVKSVRKSDLGFNETNVWTLPYHRGGSDMGSDTTGDMGSDTTGDMGSDTKTQIVSPKEREKSKERTKKESVLKTLPSDFEIDDARREKAEQLGIDPERVVMEFDKFCDYHMAKASKFSDWEAAWRTWCRNQVAWQAQRLGVQVTNYVPVVKPVTKEDRIAELVKAREKYEASGDQGFIDHINRLIAEEEAK